MDLRDFEYFAVLAEHRHVGRAAESIGLSQPALSKSLRRLEQTMHAKLVTRTPKGVELTAEGAALLARVRRLRLTLDDVKREVADVSGGRVGHLRVGAGPGMVDDLLAGACSALLAIAPKVTLTVTVATPAVLVPLLRGGELDLMVTTVPPGAYGDLRKEELLEDRFVICASTGHPLASRSRVEIADLALERWALSTSNVVSRQRLQRAFEDRGCAPPDVALEAGSVPLTLHAIAHSNLLGYVAWRVVQHSAQRTALTELRVEGMDWHRRVAVYYRQDTYLPPISHRLIEILKSAAGELAPICAR
ncbi:MAG: LysR family transcriptional regulator [Betaproteobacteria bacterium]|nr:LysR family transcriptional regulator [Betaproteobacteria bacterium]